MALVSTVAQPAAPTDGNITTASTYYGLSITNGYNRHLCELLVTIGFAALLVILYIF
jgi:hypothetical protein